MKAAMLPGMPLDMVKVMDTMVTVVKERDMVMATATIRHMMATAATATATLMQYQKNTLASRVLSIPLMFLSGRSLWAAYSLLVP